jgi:hypothetical protein
MHKDITKRVLQASTLLVGPLVFSRGYVVRKERHNPGLAQRNFPVLYKKLR